MGNNEFVTLGRWDFATTDDYADYLARKIEELAGHVIKVTPTKIEPLVPMADFGDMETQASYSMGCGEGHIFIHTGELYEGCPCVCGKTVAHFETCPTCGQSVLKPIDSEKVAIGG